MSVKAARDEGTAEVVTLELESEWRKNGVFNGYVEVMCCVWVCVCVGVCGTAFLSDRKKILPPSIFFHLSSYSRSLCS